MALHRLSRLRLYGCRGMICSNSPLAAGVIQSSGRRRLRRLPGRRCQWRQSPLLPMRVNSFVLLYEAPAGI